MNIESLNLNDLDELHELENPSSPTKSQGFDTEIHNLVHRQKQVDLPIIDSKDEILSKIRKNRVTILQGDTGCGKTTQVPQYILDDACECNEYCNIICTQPRRIAAISIAQRICNERQLEIGGLVGFQVGLHAQCSENTRLLYCTTGVLLEKLIQTKTMKNFTHIILDEVHERDQDMDFLLIIVRRLLTTNSKDTKIILMSATIDAKEFATYFKIGDNIPPVFKVDQRPMYSVSKTYLCELKHFNYSDTIIDYAKPGITEELYKLAIKLIIECVQMDTDDTDVGSILVFLPGINEIEIIEEIINSVTEIPDFILLPIKLHSLISLHEQKKAFFRPPQGYRKVILATNIAESSITVPDVKYVIDFCLARSVHTDTASNFTTLQLHWSSRSCCKQRAGRVGRVSNGQVYRLISKNFYKFILNEYKEPEMLRSPLQTIVLKAKVLDMGAPHAILRQALAPPNLSDIRNTILILKEAGALCKTCNGIYEAFDGDLTWIGKIMSILPLSVHTSRLIIFGYVFSILDEAVIIAAGSSVKSIFSHPPNNKLVAYNQKLRWADGSGSDLIAILRAYMVWCNMHEQRYINEDSEKVWAKRYMINTRSMREMHVLVRELKNRLDFINIKSKIGQERINLLETDKSIILKIVIAGAFYPNYYIQSSGNSVGVSRNTYQTLSGHDPCDTVHFNNFQPEYIGELYTKAIKNLFGIADISPNCINIRFGPTCKKVFVTFKDDPEEDPETKRKVPYSGRIRPEIFRALKLRKLRVPMRINVMDPVDAQIYAESKGLGKMVNGSWVHKKKLVQNIDLLVYPSLHTRMIIGNITHLENTGIFWFQPSAEQLRLREIRNTLNGDSIYRQPFHTESEILPGMLVAAPLDSQYERGKVLFIRRGKNSDMAIQAMISFIDFGTKKLLPVKDIQQIVGPAKEMLNVPPKVFKCSLANVQPSSISCSQGLWPKEAISFMTNIFKNGPFVLEVYSVANLVTSALIRVGNENLDEMLIKRGWGQKTEENYISKLDHEIRMRKQMCQLDKRSNFSENYLTIYQGDDHFENDLPPINECKTVIHLNGPYSPLESKLCPATKVGSWKSVGIEDNSVNSISLNTDPQDNHDKLVVAMNVTSSNNTLTIRQTTLMPNIHGFGALMTMIFCPTMQLKLNKTKTKYVSVLAGLGHDDNYQPLYDEHDIILDLDVNIDPSDIEMINQIRFSMDTLFYNRNDDNNSANDLIFDKTTNIKNSIIRLLEKPRSYIGRHKSGNKVQWEPVDDSEVLESFEIYGTESIFPLHTALKLYKEDVNDINELNEHAKDLEEMGNNGALIGSTVCKLCDEPLDNISELRLHLLSKLHKDRELQIRYQSIE